MKPELTNDPLADMEMTTKEAAAYLTGATDGPRLSTEFMYRLKACSMGPSVEKRGSRLVYRKSALDAFLRENGRDPHVWIEHVFRDIAEKMRALGAVRPDLDFGDLPDILDARRPNDWDPDRA